MLFMGLLPLPEKLQFEVIPYVSPILSYPTKPNQTNQPPTYLPINLLPLTLLIPTHR